MMTEKFELDPADNDIIVKIEQLMIALRNKKSNGAKRLKRTLSLISFEECKTHGFS